MLDELILFSSVWKRYVLTPNIYFQSILYLALSFTFLKFETDRKMVFWPSPNQEISMSVVRLAKNNTCFAFYSEQVLYADYNLAIQYENTIIWKYWPPMSDQRLKNSHKISSLIKMATLLTQDAKFVLFWMIYIKTSGMSNVLRGKGFLHFLT